MKDENEFSTSELIYDFIKDKQKRTQFHCNQSEVTIDDNGNFGIYLEPEPTALFSKKIQLDDIFLFILYFDMVDNTIDNILQDDTIINFYDKYKAIKKYENEYYKLIAEVYRVLLLFRHCYAHHRNNIKKDMSFTYFFKNKKNLIIFDNVLKNGIKCLAEYIYSISKTNNKFHKYYAYGIYERMLSKGNFCIKDKSGSGLQKISFSFKLSITTRNVYKIESCDIADGIIHFGIDSMRFQKLEERNKQESYDLLIAHEGNNYMIPKEVLHGQPQMPYEEFLTWEYINPEENL